MIPDAVKGIVNAAVDAAIVVDRDQSVLHFNRAFLALTGLRPRAIEKGPLRAACHEVIGLTSCATQGCPGRIAMDTGRPLRLDEVGTRDPEARLIVTAVPLVDAQGRVYAALETYRDVTGESRMQSRYKQLLENERRQKDILSEEVRKRTAELEQSLTQLKAARSALIQSEKMSSLGQLVAGIAHELNNPVNFIYGNMGFLQDYVEKLLQVVDQAQALSNDAAQRARFEKIAADADLEFVRGDLVKLVGAVRSGSERVATIVRDLRTFSRLGETEMKPADLNQGIATTLNLLAPKAKGKATIVRELGSLPPVVCNSAHVNQVVMNLVANAIDAIPEKAKGKVVVRSRDRGDGTVAIEVQDDGVGIDPKVLPKIFDPFFTTKEVGSGTGLGLSISFGIIEAHRGRIEVDSQPGKGSLFRVVLPVSPSAAERQAARPS